MKQPLHVLDYVNFHQASVLKQSLENSASRTARPPKHHLRSQSQRFLNFLTSKGKKYQAEYIYTQSLKSLRKKLKEKQVYSSSLTAIHDAIQNVRPFFEVKKVRVAGSTYQVPAILEQSRSEHKAMNWLKESAEDRKRKNPSLGFEDCFAQEVFDAMLAQGSARQKRNELHKLVESNRAFAHFRWW